VCLTALEGNEMERIPSLRDDYWNLQNDEYGEGDACDESVLAPLRSRWSDPRAHDAPIQVLTMRGMRTTVATGVSSPMIRGHGFGPAAPRAACAEATTG
jgi:hypothetical protein